MTGKSHDNSSYFDPPVEWYFNERVDEDFKIKNKKSQSSGRRLSNANSVSPGPESVSRRNPFDDSYVLSDDANLDSSRLDFRTT
jgi:hypothetical protein